MSHFIMHDYRRRVTHHRRRNMHDIWRKMHDLWREMHDLRFATPDLRRATHGLRHAMHVMVFARHYVRHARHVQIRVKHDLRHSKHDERRAMHDINVQSTMFDVRFSFLIHLHYSTGNFKIFDISLYLAFSLNQLLLVQSSLTGQLIWRHEYEQVVAYERSSGFLSSYKLLYFDLPNGYYN